MQQGGLDREGRAQIAVERVLEMGRVDEMLGHDVGPQVGQVVGLKELHNGIAVGPGLHAPIDICGQVRHRREHIEGLAAFRRHAGVGERRHVQVEREVLGQIAVGEDLAQQALVVLAEDDVVMGQPYVAILALRPKVDDKKRHAVLLALDPGVAVVAAILGGDEVEVGPGHIGVADHGIGGMQAAIGQAHAGHPPALGEDFFDFCAQINRAAQFREQAAHRCDDGAGAADGVMDAPLALQVVDEDIERGGVERVAADEEGVKGETAAQEVILDEFGDVAVDAAVGLQPHQVGGDAGHIGGVQERLVDQGDAGVEDFLRGGDEAGVAILVGRVELVDLLEDEVVVAVVVQITFVVAEDAVEGVEREEAEVVSGLLPGQRPQLVQHPGGGDDGGAAVEGEAVAFVDIGAAAEFVAFLEERDLVALGGQADGGAKAAEAAADDDDFLRHFGFLGQGIVFVFYHKGVKNTKETGSLLRPILWTAATLTLALAAPGWIASRPANWTPQRRPSLTRMAAVLRPAWISTPSSSAQGR